jgi:hypothetical protein
LGLMLVGENFRDPMGNREFGCGAALHDHS